VSHQKPTKTFTIKIDSDAMRYRPSLINLPTQIDAVVFNDFLKVIEDIGFECSIYLNKIHVSMPQNKFRGKTDYLGLDYLPRHINDISDVIREATGVDPRRNLVYSAKGSIYENMQRSRNHPFDPIPAEEIRLRRLLAESHWNRQRFHDRQRKESNEREEKIEYVQEYFRSK